MREMTCIAQTMLVASPNSYFRTRDKFQPGKQLQQAVRDMHKAISEVITSGSDAVPVPRRAIAPLVAPGAINLPSS